jgi:two-component sensor histidine kinase
MVDTVCPPRSMTSTHGRWPRSRADPAPAALAADRLGLSADTVDDALLVVEELVANVLDHARTRFQLTCASPARAALAVHDGSSGSPQVRPVRPARGSGPGLQLV